MSGKAFRISLLLVLTGLLFTQCKKEAKEPEQPLDETLTSLLPDTCPHIILDSNLYREGWSTLPQPAFWRKVMRLSLDTTLINTSRNRTVVGVIPTQRWMSLSEKGKKQLEDSVRMAFGVDKSDQVFFTAGKSHFYRMEMVIADIPRAIEVFQHNQTDPWYAQAIMLIESPVGLRFSTAGAYGPFQLMAGVARQFGLVVTDSLDEREVFDCSAEAAAKLISSTCVPKARSLLEAYGIIPDEEAIWFRLLVLHVYHAGAGNVRGVLKKINPTQGGPDLIREIWRTEYRNFGNSSQNYTQIALAAMLEADSLMRHRLDTCQGISLPPIPYSNRNF